MKEINKLEAEADNVGHVGSALHFVLALKTLENFVQL